MTIIDLSTWNGPVDWPAVAAECVMVRGPIGDRWVDDRFHANWPGAKTRPRQGVYCDLITGQSGAAQALNILHQTGADFGTEAVGLDVERTKAERLAMDAGTLIWDKAAYTAMLFDVVQALVTVHPVRLYTSKIEWEAMTTSPSWALELLNWIAHYNDHIAAPDVPAGWTWDWWQYGQAQVAGIADPVDVSRERVKPMANSKVMVPRGSLATLHADTPGQTVPVLAAAAKAGWPYPSLVILNDAGVCMDVKRVSPTTYTLCRYYNPVDDSLQGLDDWTTQQRADWVARVLHKIYSNINDAQARATDWCIAWNEEDPPDGPNFTPGEHGYRNLAETFIMLIDANEARRAAGQLYVKLALGCLAQGTPEWFEMVEMVETGLFARMQAVGYCWCVHEGVFRGQRISDGYGDNIPGAPQVAGAGSACFRFVYLFEGLLRPRGQLVPLFIGEWYGGGQIHDPVPDHISYMAWYDDRLALFEYALGFAAFTAWPTPDWDSSDYSPVFLSAELDAWRAARAGRINGGLMPQVSDADLAQLAANNQADAVILAKYKPAHVWKAGDVALAVANPIQLYDANHNASGKPRTDYTSDIDVLAVSVDGQWLKVFNLPEYWVRAADVKRKV